MSANGDDVLRIPIEVKTDDLKELQELIQDISQAEQDIREIKPRRGRGKGDTSSRAPFQEAPEEERFGIFGEDSGKALPSKGRDKKSAQPFQRESEFAKLQKDVAEVKTGFDAKQGLGAATQAVGFAQLVGGGKSGGLGAIAGVASKAFIPLAIITTIVEVANTVLQAFLAPGGPWDRRFRRDIKKEAASASERALKKQIAQSIKIIRVSTKAGVRGPATTASSNAYLSGNPVYDGNLEMRSKGL